MSRLEVVRLYDDIKINSSLANRLQTGAQGLRALTESARDAGYDISVDELKSFIVENSYKSLSDEELAKVAAAGSTFSVVATSTFVSDPIVATAVTTVVTVVVR